MSSKIAAKKFLPVWTLSTCAPRRNSDAMAVMTPAAAEKARTQEQPGLLRFVPADVAGRSVLQTANEWVEVEDDP